MHKYFIGFLLGYLVGLATTGDFDEVASRINQFFNGTPTVESMENVLHK